MKVLSFIAAFVATTLVGSVIAAPVAEGNLAQRSELTYRGLVCASIPPKRLPPRL